jgi:dTMP kinase
MLAVFEGIDGSGKNTQIQKLLSFFRQEKIRYRLHKYPTRKAKDVFAHLSGKKSLPPEELAEVFASDILSEQSKIRREIASGFVVICDRYLHSTLAYQGTKARYGKLREALASRGVVVPDIVFILDIEPQAAAERKRAQKNPDLFERNTGFLAEVRRNYLRMAQDNFLSYKYVIVDASMAPDDIFAQIAAQVEPLLTKKMRN